MIKFTEDQQKIRLTAAFGYYGYDKQLAQYQEEIEELRVELAKGPKADKEAVKSELADVLNMIMQFKEYFNISDHQLNEVANYKMRRQMKRIYNSLEEENK